MSRILVVDDDPSTRFVMRLILERDGHEIAEAAHGQAALDMIAERPPDIVTTDLMMPVLNGHQLILMLRSNPRTAAIPVVVVASNPDAAQDFVAAGLVSAIVGKPFDAAGLAQRIRAVESNLTNVILT
jgi:CheY-like chemotaxis protein